MAEPEHNIRVRWPLIVAPPNPTQIDHESLYAGLRRRAPADPLTDEERSVLSVHAKRVFREKLPPLTEVPPIKVDESLTAGHLIAGQHVRFQFVGVGVDAIVNEIMSRDQLMRRQAEALSDEEEWVFEAEQEVDHCQEQLKLEQAADVQVGGMVSEHSARPSGCCGIASSVCVCVDPEMNE